MKRTSTVMSILLSCLFFSGCEESLTPAQIQLWSGQIAGISEKIDDYQEVTADAVESLADKELIGAETRAAVEKVSREIDRVQPTLESISAEIAAVEITEDDFFSWIELARAANEGSAPVNPYAPYIDLGLGGLASIAAYFAARKAKEASAAQLKNQSYKVGIESAKLALGDNKVSKTLYDSIGDARAKLGVK